MQTKRDVGHFCRVCCGVTLCAIGFTPSQERLRAMNRGLSGKLEKQVVHIMNQVSIPTRPYACEGIAAAGAATRGRTRETRPCVRRAQQYGLRLWENHSYPELNSSILRSVTCISLVFSGWWSYLCVKEARVGCGCVAGLRFRGQVVVADELLRAPALPPGIGLA